MINQTILDMTGLNPNKILNNKIGKNNPNDSLVIALNEFRESNKVVFQKEILLNIKGSEKSFLLILKKFDTDTKQILSITIDIEEQKQMRAELEQQKIKLQNSAKLASLGEMASGISHEINNPLQIVGGRAEILRDEINEHEQLDPEFKARMSKGLKSIEDMSARIAKIIKGLKTFARNAENDPMDICLLEDIVQDTLSFCNQRFQKNNIEFDYINECKDFKLKGRATQLSQVLLNLLNNSFDAIMEKPKQNPFIHLKITKDQNGFAAITVTDNGTGISAEFKEKIMTPFQTTKPVGKGTGLGLSISRGIVEDHGGHLQFNFDNPDTTVFFTLPEYNA
jgi:C4-dicarboxylate-specific signal transduction histidine kinase